MKVLDKLANILTPNRNLPYHPEKWFFKVEEIEDESEDYRNTIGGRPFLPASINWPKCPVSHLKMVHFLQFDFPEEWVKYRGYRFVLFSSPMIFDSPYDPEKITRNSLPDHFWEIRPQHYKAMIFKNADTQCTESDFYLKPQKIVFTENGNKSMIRLGGKPQIFGLNTYPKGNNGESFEFFLKIPKWYPFTVKDQENIRASSLGYKDFHLFSGGELKLYASLDYDSDEAIWIDEKV